MRITDAAPLIARGELSPVALTRSCLARIDARRDLNAFITVLAESAIAEAQQAESEIRGGRYRGPLHGIPVSIKDIIDVAGVPTTSASRVPPIHPADDAPVVKRLRAAGAVIVGKTNLHEFAFGTTTDDSAFGPVRNPFDLSRSAGGSSSGAAVALAEGMCLGAIGTDTGGSIRIPAAACGIVGLKGTYGEIIADGVVALSHSCDHVGPMACSVEDARIMFDALRGTPPRSAVPRNGPLVFGIPGGYLLERIDPEVRAALARVTSSLIAARHRIVDVDIELSRSTPDIYLHIVLPEAGWYHAPLLEAHASAYSPAVRLRLEMGRYVLAEDYLRAQHLRKRLRRAVDEALSSVDALLLPALAIPAPPLGATTVDVDGTPEPVRNVMLRLTQIFNLTGHPAIALPCGRAASGLPLGMQLVGRRNETDQLLAVAAAVEPQMIAGPGSVGGGTG
jgi:aspartyl-tRNA(Asn)/glutamyl-tRNA(Gln) amidotransferase subunit A